MKKTLLAALVLLGLTVIVILFNSARLVDLNLLVTTVNMKAALAYFVFTALGVVIGVLLK
jgi:hypothetical protein